MAVGGGCTAAGFCWVPVREKASLRAEKRFLAGGDDALAFGPGAAAPEMEGRVLEKEGLEVMDGDALWPQVGGPFAVGVGVVSTCCRPGDDCKGRSRGGAAPWGWPAEPSLSDDLAAAFRPMKNGTRFLGVSWVATLASDTASPVGAAGAAEELPPESLSRRPVKSLELRLFAPWPGMPGGGRSAESLVKVLARKPPGACPEWFAGVWASGDRGRDDGSCPPPSGRATPVSLSYP